MFQLFGPLSVFFFILALLRRFREHMYVGNEKKKQKKKKEEEAELSPPRDDVDARVDARVLIGVALLSILPHQEPRFILPLVVPLTSLSGVRKRAGRLSGMDCTLRCATSVDITAGTTRGQ